MRKGKFAGYVTQIMSQLVDLIQGLASYCKRYMHNKAANAFDVSQRMAYFC